MYTRLGFYNNSGVYAYLNEERYPIYIGRAANLGERLRVHRTKMESHMPDARFLFVHFCQDHESLEKKLIQQYCPKYNKLDNPEPQLDIQCITCH